jgi:hypothetical protein
MEDGLPSDRILAIDVMENVKKIKAALPQTYILLGGFTASFFHEEIMRNFDGVDGIIRGEAEVPMLDLANSLLQGKMIFFHSQSHVEEEGEKISGGLVWVLMAISLAFGIALFSVAPLFLTNELLGSSAHTILFNLTEGLIRIAIFILYLGLINLIPSIKQVFAYHGAEHKAVNAYEAGCSAGSGSGQKIQHGSYALRHQLPVCGVSHLYRCFCPGRPAFSVADGAATNPANPGYCRFQLRGYLFWRPTC